MNIVMPSQKLSSRTISVVGFSGVKQTLPISTPLHTVVGRQRVSHPFVCSPSSPVNLLGRDLLIALGATILCGPDGLLVTFPDGSSHACTEVYTHGQFLLQQSEEHLADIYWGLLQPESTDHAGILSCFLLWKPWIQALAPYGSAPDFPHVTLFYDRDQTEWYQEQFEANLASNDWTVFSQDIYVAPEGVAAAVNLTQDQLFWYKMHDEAVPHISLALHPGHQAMELGGVVKRSLAASDWQNTVAPDLFFSPSTNTYKIKCSAVDSVVLEHVQLPRHHGRELTDHPTAAAMLASLPECLWATGPTDVGLVDVTPVTFDLQPGPPIWRSQYPHKRAAEEGIAETIGGLLEAGVLESSTSSWNTPILPVEKKGTGKYRMAHDLRAINSVLLTPTVPVPNPHVALTNLDPSQTWFSCVDLANAFFCLPLDEECRDVFSFTYRGQQLRYTRLPQGFALSPGLFNQVLKQQLADCFLPEGVTLIQYVDDLMLAAQTLESCIEGTRSLLSHLADRGFKVSRSKLQIARKQVSFLGRIITGTGTQMSASHKSAILNHPKPCTVKDMLSFLGLTGYSRNYVPNYTELTDPLRALVREHGIRQLTHALTWTMEAEEAFISLKQQLAAAAQLAIPDYSLPFYLDVSVTELTVNAVLFQKTGGERKILQYVSAMLDPMEIRHPACTRHAAGVGKMIQKIAHIVMGHPLQVMTSHSVVAYVNSQHFTLTTLRQQKLSKILESPNITFVHNGVNMADRMQEGEPHNCEELVQKEEKIRPDLQASPLAGEGVRNFYTDGCCFRHDTDGLRAAFAVVEDLGSEFHVLRAERLQGAQSAQRAELKAMIEALKLAEGMRVNLYSDSAYVASAVHVELPQWLRAGFITAARKPIKHETEMKELAEALLLPQSVAVIKCKGHDQSKTRVAAGNAAADEAAKEAAGYLPSLFMVSTEMEQMEQNNLEKIIFHQKGVSPEERSVWKARGAICNEGLWRGPNGKVILPPNMRFQVFQEAHGLGHVGIAQMLKNLEHWWHPFLRDMVKNHVKTCEICGQHNAKPTVRPPVGHFPWTTQPGKEIIIDFTDMITPVRGYRYVLMCVDAYSSWPEAWPAKKEDSKTVIKCLINYYIPTHGFPEKVRSDNGTHFRNQDLQKVEQLLGLKHSFGFSPYELQTGRMFPGPATRIPGWKGELAHLSHKDFFNELQILAGEFVKYQTTQERPGSPPVPGLDWVRLKVIKRKWSEPRFTGPYRVVERTSHAVRLQGKGDTWFHWSQCTAAEEPQRALRDVQEDLQLQSSDEEQRQALPGGSVAGIPATTTSSS
ncbi:uncharacterized protein LOC116731404 [Xiphophorus hellerii]|uniref:uncharacterized protein LOC116731404 n=1 Tax=Xiphophorus hellerii TaxID=8084 RepID=UPI0013B3807F|nr:uncharacterized protein LOC116731404 [Xiphophorus hellerii]